MLVHPSAGVLMLIESDHAAYTDASKTRKRNEMADVSWGYGRRLRW